MGEAQRKHKTIFDTVKVNKINPKILQDFFISLELYYQEIHPRHKNSIKVHYEPIMGSFEPVAYTPLEKGVLIKELRPLFTVNKFGRKKIEGRLSYPVRPLNSFLKILKFERGNPLNTFVGIIDYWNYCEDQFLMKGDNMRFIETKGYGDIIDFYKKWENLTIGEKRDNALELLSMDNKLAGKSL